jgi:hypothetical protein
MWPAVFRQSNPSRWALALSFFFVATGILVPNTLRHIHRVWMVLGNALGWINSKVLLTLIYYIIVMPISLLKALTGHDSMNRKFDRETETYRINRTPRPASHMKHQF